MSAAPRGKSQYACGRRGDLAANSSPPYSKWHDRTLIRVGQIPPGCETIIVCGSCSCSPPTNWQECATGPNHATIRRAVTSSAGTTNDAAPTGWPAATPNPCGAHAAGLTRCHPVRAARPTAPVDPTRQAIRPGRRDRHPSCPGRRDRRPHRSSRHPHRRWCPGHPSRHPHRRCRDRRPGRHPHHCLCPDHPSRHPAARPAATTAWFPGRRNRHPTQPTSPPQRSGRCSGRIPHPVPHRPSSAHTRTAGPPNTRRPVHLSIHRQPATGSQSARRPEPGTDRGQPAQPRRCSTPAHWAAQTPPAGSGEARSRHGNPRLRPPLPRRRNSTARPPRKPPFPRLLNAPPAGSRRDPTPTPTRARGPRNDSSKPSHRSTRTRATKYRSQVFSETDQRRKRFRKGHDKPPAATGINNLQAILRQTEKQKSPACTEAGRVDSNQLYGHRFVMSADLEHVARLAPPDDRPPVPGFQSSATTRPLPTRTPPATGRAHRGSTQEGPHRGRVRALVPGRGAVPHVRASLGLSAS